MITFIVSCCLALGLISAIMAITSDSTERLLWGSILCSIGLGAAVELVSGGYYGILIIAVFLATDIVVYHYFRTQELMPARPARNRRGDWFYRLFFLWLSLCSVVAGSLAIIDFGQDMTAENSVPSLALLHDRIWSSDWLLALIPLLFLLVIVTGGFFLVRRER